MKITLEHAYSANAETIFSILQDPELIVARYLKTGALSAEVVEHSSKSKSALQIRVKRTVEVEVPALLSKFINPTTEVTQSEQWKCPAGGPYTSEMQIESRGAPVKLYASMMLVDKGKGSVNTISIEAKCGIPLVGGKIADFVLKDAQRTANLEYEFIKSHLKKRK